jgi:PHD/YefM family antitoxin component YafN of YafNO toxin-antitoxin module
MEEVNNMQNMVATEAERVSIRDLYSSPEKIEEQLRRTGQLVLTNDNNPVAVMIKVDGLTVEDTIDDLRRGRALRALKTIQETSVRNGTSNMTLEEINAEIAAARAEKRAR